MSSIRIGQSALLGLGFLSAAAAGCHQPEQWAYSGPRVYLIEGTAGERSDGLAIIRHELARQEINAKIYYPDDWLKIVVDIDAKPDEQVILVGHGHGAFLATQVVRHYAQEHKTKFIEAVFTIDAFNKDWPHNCHERCICCPHTPPMDTPIGHNALKVENYVQRHGCCKRWGSELASTRASNAATAHPYYWYDDYWDRRPLTGQRIATDLSRSGVCHESIDNHAALVQRIIKMCRKAALSAYHYTPPEHHPDVAPKASPSRAAGRSREAT
jgi:hypothetical protein